MEIPKYPVVFTKQATAANGPYAPIHAPAETNLLDYEGELGMVIGKRCRRVTKADAPKVVAGYCVLNDVRCESGNFWLHRPNSPWVSPGTPTIHMAPQLSHPTKLILITSCFAPS